MSQPLRLRSVILSLALVLGTSAAGGPAFAADKAEIAGLIRDLRAADWQTVYDAHERLVALRQEAIPALLELADSREIVKLTNTLDLSYPGAANFYGHGMLLSYDIVCLGVRAGWVLDDLTFQSFGFSE